MDEESIFAAALEKQSPGERAAFLDEACQGNAPLRAEVDELLQAYRDASGFLESPAAEFPGTVCLDQFDDETVRGNQHPIQLDFLAPCDIPGRVGKLGLYEVLEVVGRGGMGIVLLAYDAKLNREVAIKVVAPELAADPTAARRFLREAQGAAAVRHENVVIIHAVDDSQQLPFLVMEYVHGFSLEAKIDHEGALELEDILRIGAQVASGLEAAHKQGLIHRDVKPANILLEGGAPKVKITDFGLARAASELSVTQTGHVAGTPLYMSPQQAQGVSIDHRSDLFSLGSVLYTMCTGQAAFQADGQLAVLRRVVDDTPLAVRKLNARVPEWLAAVIDKLLAKQPAERFQSAQQVADLLNRGLQQVQNSSLPMPPQQLASGAVPPEREPRDDWAPKAFASPALVHGSGRAR